MSVDKIHVLDEIELVQGVDLDEFVASFRSRYQPLAEVRGMTLAHLWVTPPEGPSSLNTTVLFVWELDGVAGFWQMRSQNAQPAVLEWWAECDRKSVRRTRRFAIAPDAVEAFGAAGRSHA